MAKWKRGQSGNPNGRPNGSRNKSTAEIKELLADSIDFPAIVKKLEAKALQGSELAAKILLEHRFGRPKQESDINLQPSIFKIFSNIRLASSPEQGEDQEPKQLE